MVKKSRSKSSKRTRKKTAKKTTRKKATKKKVTRKKVARKPAKKARKKATRKKAPAKRKKATRKATRKKAPAKRTRKAPAKKRSKSPRTVSRHRVYNLTREVPEEHYFVLANGQPVKHVAELASILDQLEDHVFSHHVSADRNDFHSWIKDIFADVQLARKVLGITDKKRLQLVIYRHLAGHE